MNKKGIQLSVNFLVIIILALVVMGFGLTLFYKLIDTSVDTVQTVDRQTEERMERLLQSGELVVVSDTTKSVKSGESADFYVAISNEAQTQKVFTVDVEQKGSDLGDEGISFYDGQIVYRTETESIEVNGFVVVPIRIVSAKKTPKASFIFLVTVKEGITPYGSKQQLILNVNK